MSKISFNILISVSVKIIRLGVQFMIYQFLITSFFWLVDKMSMVDARISASEKKIPVLMNITRKKPLLAKFRVKEC